MMDTLIEQKKGFKKKYISYVIAGLLLTLAVGWLFFGNRTRRVYGSEHIEYTIGYGGIIQ